MNTIPQMISSTTLLKSYLITARIKILKKQFSSQKITMINYQNISKEEFSSIVTSMFTLLKNTIIVPKYQPLIYSLNYKTFNFSTNSSNMKKQRKGVYLKMPSTSILSFLMEKPSTIKIYFNFLHPISHKYQTSNAFSIV